MIVLTQDGFQKFISLVTGEMSQMVREKDLQEMTDDAVAEIFASLGVDLTPGEDGTIKLPEGTGGRGIVGFERTAGDGSPGSDDTYTITFSDDTTFSFTVHNGADGQDGADGADGTGGGSGSGVGQIVSGQLMKNSKGQMVTAKERAEIFNNYSDNSATGVDAHAEGTSCIADGNGSHAEGEYSAATANGAHAEGMNTRANGIDSHSEGANTKANGVASHAEGNATQATGNYAHSEGQSSQATAESAHAEGKSTYAFGKGAHTEGWEAEANGEYAHAEGIGTQANTQAVHAGGLYNRDDDYEPETPINLMVLGNGHKDGSTPTRSNAFRVSYAGEVYGMAEFKSTGADYAEYFEWADGNTEAEDRVGHFVTMDGDKIKYAKQGDYILGVVSGQPCLIGNADEDWLGRWEHDEFGRFIKEKVNRPVKETIYQDVQVLDDNGNPTGRTSKHAVEVDTGRTVEGWHYKENPNYNTDQKYVERKDRQEWDAVGMMGVLSVIDNGTCQVNGYAQPGANGIATAAAQYVPAQTYRVIARVNDHIVKIIFR